MRIAYLLTFLLLPVVLWSQPEKRYLKGEPPIHGRHYGGMQFVGQSFVSFHYDFAFVHTKHLSVLVNAGIGIGENGDSDIDGNTLAYTNYVVHHSLFVQGGFENLKVVAGLAPATYLTKRIVPNTRVPGSQAYHYSYVNMHGFFGLRILPMDEVPTLSILVFYMPEWTSTTSNATHIGIPIGVRMGVNF